MPTRPDVGSTSCVLGSVVPSHTSAQGRLTVLQRASQEKKQNQGSEDSLKTTQLMAEPDLGLFH